MINPSSDDLAEYDKVNAARDHINPWSRWQHGLSADILLVGQDWGTPKLFKENEGQDPGNNCPTNVRICKLFKSLDKTYQIGVADRYVDYTLSDSRLFFTNIVQCLKPGDKMSSPLSSEVANECAEEFLRDLIGIIKPKVIIALGNKAFQSLVKLYKISAPSSLREIFLPDGGYKDEYKTGFALLGLTAKLFPVYHCSPLGLANRGPNGLTKDERFELQKKDWIDIKNYLRCTNN